MNFYLSLETAKQLKEWGCELESVNYYVNRNYEEVLENPKKVSKDWLVNRYDFEKTDWGYWDYPAYHILEDVCVRYATEFFSWLREPTKIMVFLQVDKKQEAEQYILDNTIFNPKNK